MAPPPRTYTTDVVMVDGTVIRTTVTNSGAAVERFLRGVIRNNPRHLLVGIDTEWRVVFDPNGKRSYRTAVLQLCVGNRCLVFQIVHANYVPVIALGDFFACPDHRFAGVEVGGDFKRLYEDYGFEVTNTVELKSVAAEVLCRPELKQAGLKTLTREVMGVLIDKPKRVTMSRWDAYRLSQEQVDYACIDAFTSYEVGRLLLSGQCAAGDLSTAATSTNSSPSVASVVHVC
ncbi:hypothetical protein QOZ80_1AG0027370 [Eleusine coracana subsp. coracana]|nr:hypothetical protein QOZ80_1AG0027370 [Eleusine coracana subsp. coracana]